MPQGVNLLIALAAPGLLHIRVNPQLMLLTSSLRLERLSPGRGDRRGRVWEVGWGMGGGGEVG